MSAVEVERTCQECLDSVVVHKIIDGAWWYSADYCLHVGVGREEKEK